MSKVWVRARTIIHIEENGKAKAVHPGDWVQIGRHQARTLLTNNQIEILKTGVLKSVQDLTDCTILLKGVLPEPKYSLLMASYPGVPVKDYDNGLPNRGRMLIWNTSAELRRELILTGFKLLEKWQLAVPLLDYNILAKNIGTAAEQKATKTIIHDLRVPVYDCRVIFADNYSRFASASL
jgi:hypothetical protein